MGELRTMADENDKPNQYRCVLCEKLFTQDHAGIYLMDGDRRMGTLCPGCVEAGPKVAAQRARAYADRLRLDGPKWAGYADHLERMAGAVARITAWATLEDLAEVRE